MVEASTTSPATLSAAQLTLNTGAKMPQVGLGLWKIPKEVCAQTVFDAISAGYRCLDGACDYGNEKEVGQGIKMAIDGGVVKREDLFIVSKLWNTFHRPEHVETGCRKSLEDLGLDYLDLYLIHFPIAMPFVPIETTYPPEWVNNDPAINGGKARMCLDNGVTYQQTYQAMEELHAKGLVKAIGVSNVQSRHLREIHGYAKVKPSVLQVEIHPKLTQELLVRQAKEYGMAVTGYSMLGALSYVELSMATPEESVTLNGEVQAFATKYGKTPAQLIFRWGIQRGIQIIPKSSKKARLEENVAIFDFCLTADEMAKISSFNENKRYNDPGQFTLGMDCFCPIYD